jgi:hypothetical protein
MLELNFIINIVIGIQSLQDWHLHTIKTPDVTGAIGFPALQAGPFLRFAF